MSGSKFEIFNPHLTDYNFDLTYNTTSGVQTEYNIYKNKNEIECIKSFRVDTLFTKLQDKTEEQKTKKLIQNLYSLVHDINYSLSGDYRPTKYVDTYYNIREDIETIDKSNMKPEDFIIDKKSLSNMYTSSTTTMSFDGDEVEIYEVKDVNCIKCLEDIIEIKNIPEKQEKILEKTINILYKLRENKIKKTNEIIKELKSMNP